MMTRIRESVKTAMKMTASVTRRPGGHSAIPRDPRAPSLQRARSVPERDCVSTNDSLRHDVFNHAEDTHRYSRMDSGKDEILLYTDGACLDNGRDDARGGCAFVSKAVDPS